ncbi:hypothetical protein CHU95_00010 [Niveispirillum lacus]|uniref:Uncharacterized protein n=1 Tax=Niveispirillum lacus TaxID=1981099 RepID=A0A255Z945_9PROT|nr:hypothetical protein [Niveispirillum lacus]OYQ38067.1 hypothetical protein CHU95_00010 [Niveispirillum lacus]
MPLAAGVAAKDGADAAMAPIPTIPPNIDRRVSDLNIASWTMAAPVCDFCQGRSRRPLIKPSILVTVRV